MACCPPNSHAYLAPDYKEVGSVIEIDGTELYISGQTSTGKGILIIPDVYGFHGGRVRNIADQFAEAGYFAIVPKLLVPALRGGTDNDGNTCNKLLLLYGMIIYNYILQVFLLTSTSPTLASSSTISRLSLMKVHSSPESPLRSSILTTMVLAR